MKTFATILMTGLLLTASIGPHAQTTGDNQESRAIGIAHGALSDCLSTAYSQGSAPAIYALANPFQDSDGEATGNWVVTFYNSNQQTCDASGCVDQATGRAVMNNWVVTSTVCFIRTR